MLILHRLAAVLASLCVGGFFLASISLAFFANHTSLVSLKSWILWPGLGILIPAMAATGISGFLLARKRAHHTLVQKKQHTMKWLVINGFCILIPCAFLLDYWATEENLQTSFYLIQGVELIAGGINLGLLFINFKRGIDLRASTGN